MDPARWQRIEELFAAARQLPSNARLTLLDEACAGDGELQAEVLALLAAAEGSFELLDNPLLGTGALSAALARQPPSSSDGDTLPAPPGAAHHPAIVPGPVSSARGASLAGPDAATRHLYAPGRRLGPWRLGALIGVGGMGSVHKAERADGAYDQTVALKLIRAETWDGESRRRFARERELLAGLEHPGIARLLDGGTSVDGEPYFVMEYVRGSALDAWCDEQRLAVRERLLLFLDVCEAVSYAHGRLVIHRDIKPANILVTDERAPKLLDFGVARMLDPQGAQAERTRAFLTPRYASPEQVRGQALGTSTDVYSLGVVLYELLTGRHTQPGMGTTPVHEFAKRLCEREPTAASTRVARDDVPETDSALAGLRRTSPEALRRTLSGDLDQILLKALRIDAAARYASVDQLAADIRRYLACLPVQARPAGIGYRSARWLRRHRLLSGAAGLLVVTWLVAQLLVIQALFATQRAEGEAALQGDQALAALAREQRLAQAAGVHAEQARLDRERARSARDEEQGLAEIAEQRTREISADTERIEAANVSSAQGGRFVEFILLPVVDTVEGRDALVVDSLDHAVALLDDGALPWPDVEAFVRRALGASYIALTTMEQQAEAQLQIALALELKTLGENSLAVARTRIELAYLRLLQRRLRLSKEFSGPALAALLEHHVEQVDDVLRAGALLADALISGEFYSDVLPLAEHLTTFCRSRRGEDSVESVNWELRLALALRSTGSRDEALAVSRRALTVARRISGDDSSLSLGVWLLTCQLLLATGEREQARSEALLLRPALAEHLADDHVAVGDVAASRAFIMARVDESRASGSAPAPGADNDVVSDVYGKRYRQNHKLAFDMALLWQSLEEPRLASESAAQAHAIAHQIYGPKHRLTLNSAIVVIQTDLTLGELLDAIDLAGWLHGEAVDQVGLDNALTRWVRGVLIDNLPEAARLLDERGDSAGAAALRGQREELLAELE